MKLNRAIVREVLERIGTFRFTSTLHGFEMTRWMEGETWRLVHGGGISGQGDRYWWMERKDGAGRSRICVTRGELRQVIIEWLAGERPVERAGYTLYARKHSTRFTESYQWFYRKGGTRLHAPRPTPNQ